MSAPNQDQKAPVEQPKEAPAAPQEPAKHHHDHHIMSQVGGGIGRAMMFGFGATLGADAANGIVGDAKEWWRH